MRTIQKHNIRFDPVNPAQQIKEDLPIWHHKFIPRRARPRYNTLGCVCLRMNHEIRTVGDMVAFEATFLECNEHERSAKCKCAACTAARRSGCPEPRKCKKTASTLLGKLPKKWDPREPFRANHELTAEELVKNSKQKEKGGALIFDPALPRETTFEQCFRLFGLQNAQDPRP
ncbi:hypothetical protein HDZ31DRAFT_32015, partial [Schizophyllum fasciatum]